MRKRSDITPRTRDGVSHLEPKGEIRALKAFLDVARAGSMTDTSRNFGITQSAVSQMIAQLEADLRIELFDRSQRPLRLTSAGNQLVSRAASLVDDYERLISEARHIGRTKLPDLRLAVVESFAATIGPSFFREVMRSVERMVIWVGLAPIQAEALINRNVDVVLGSEPLDDVAFIASKRILREPFLLVLPKTPAYRKKSLSLSETTKIGPMISFSGRSHMASQINRHLKRMKVTPPRVLEIDTSSVMVALVASGVGWSVMTPLCLLQGEKWLSEVTVLPFPGPAFGRGLYVLHRTGELEHYARLIAAAAEKILRSELVAALNQVLPNFADEIIIGESDDD